MVNAMQSAARVKMRCKGAVLLLAMVFLLLLAVLAGTSMQASILQVRMASNELFQEEAFQRALAIVDAIGIESDNFPVEGQVGHTLCKTSDSANYCDSQQTVKIDRRVLDFPEGLDVAFEVERMAPLFLQSLPVRRSQQFVSSSLAYDAAVFEIHAKVDGHERGLGTAEAVRGVALLVPSSTGSSAE
ncbi:MAG: type II secretory pathway pseudopilin PulG [Halioglobus sp.]|jgi:type II secretory pathway pseudopilin PulG